MTFEQARDYLLQKARAMGVDAEVLATHTRELTVQAHGGRVEEITQATQGGVGVRVVVGGKTGYAYTEERTLEALDWVLAEAHENALLQSEGGGFLLEGGQLGQHDLLGEGLSAPLEQKRQAALDVEAGLRAENFTTVVSLPFAPCGIEFVNRFSIASGSAFKASKCSICLRAQELWESRQ